MTWGWGLGECENAPWTAVGGQVRTRPDRGWTLVGPLVSPQTVNSPRAGAGSELRGAQHPQELRQSPGSGSVSCMTAVWPGTCQPWTTGSDASLPPRPEQHIVKLKENKNGSWFARGRVEINACALFPHLRVSGRPEPSPIPSAAARTTLGFVPAGISASRGSLDPLP